MNVFVSPCVQVTQAQTAHRSAGPSGGLPPPSPAPVAPAPTEPRVSEMEWAEAQARLSVARAALSDILRVQAQDEGVATETGARERVRDAVTDAVRAMGAAESAVVRTTTQTHTAADVATVLAAVAAVTAADGVVCAARAASRRPVAPSSPLSRKMSGVSGYEPSAPYASIPDRRFSGSRRSVGLSLPSSNDSYATPPRRPSFTPTPHPALSSFLALRSSSFDRGEFGIGEADTASVSSSGLSGLSDLSSLSCDSSHEGTVVKCYRQDLASITLFFSTMLGLMQGADMTRIPQDYASSLRQVSACESVCVCSR